MLLFIVPIFLLLIGQKARNSGFDNGLRQLVNLGNRYPTNYTAFCCWTLSDRRLCCQFTGKLNRVLNEPIRFDEIVIFIINGEITV